jgi:4-amino-4-deoxy-L-arabinose transferase-like glycosyltransferase
MRRPSTALDAWVQRAALQHWPVLLLLGGGAAILLLGLGAPALYDPHESLYAEIAREMVVSGDWLTPRLNGTRYLDKPPLIYWLIVLSYRLFGVSEFSARLPNALAGLAGVLVTYGVGRRLLGGSASFLAGLVLTTSVGYFVFSRQLLPDMVFACCTTIGMAGLIGVVRQSRWQQRWTMVAYFGLALAVMTKGVLGFFPLGVVAIYVLWIGRWQALRALASPVGISIFVALTVPWHAYIAWRNTGYFWHYFANEQFLRFLGQRHPIDFISLPLPIFWLLLFLWLLPWSPYLALDWRQRWLRLGPERPDEEPVVLLLLLWAGLLLVFFSMSRARLPQYSLPAMPALALLIGKSLDDRWQGRISRRAGVLVATAVSVLLPGLAALLLPPYLGQYHQFGVSAETAARIRLVFGCMAGGSALALLGFMRQRWALGWLGLTLGMAAAFFFTHEVLVQLEPYRSSRAIAALIEGQPGVATRIVLEVEKGDPFEYEQIAGLVFYTGQPVDLLRRQKPPVPSLPLRPTERFLLSEAAFRQLWASETPVYLVTDSFLDDDGVLGRHTTFALVGQVGQRWVVTNHP